MQGTELVSFQIISSVGTARSMYIEAIQEAKTGNFEKAAQLIEEGENLFIQGHHAHKELVTKEANGESVEFTLLLMHAEDQMMSTESFKIVAEEFISVHQKLEKLIRLIEK
ncbi:PTS lactose/cellobiose transporter subunit IIA [Bacillus sp. Au-Bac7]|uniref:PTS lactose/cellobiose transporter subunit IIA n=1 Tax=Bacillus sp. Au-Bac7 TaxID=2906458 RepID=UPI001E64A7FC|nr:PTS lactose/cellobiose transporter subunit IIA [Bacillus sp. Au-Bac7]MCE4052203.1 PTS lactose/cellobiose transporter subunit IIA [Bacillus sp. Au-Bac7]